MSMNINPCFGSRMLSFGKAQKSEPANKNHIFGEDETLPQGAFGDEAINTDPSQKQREREEAAGVAYEINPN